MTIKQNPYKLSYNQNLEVTKEIPEMLLNGVTEHTVSPWASLVVLYYER